MRTPISRRMRISPRGIPNLGNWVYLRSVYAVRRTLYLGHRRVRRRGLRDLYLTNSITQHNVHFFSLPLLFNLFMDLDIPIDEKIVRSANISASLGFELPLPFGFRFSASTKPLAEYRNTIDFGAGELTPVS